MGFNSKNKWGYDLDIEVFVFGHNGKSYFLYMSVSQSWIQQFQWINYVTPFQFSVQYACAWYLL